uniref:Adenylate kinase 7b n=1 Tax=Sparus aurata TaxID=8175 RepID=A0A671XHN6_SPAAU
AVDNMAEPRMERGGHTPKRVFINNTDSYASKHIAKFLSECELRPPAGPEGQTKTGDEEDGVVSLQNQRAEGAFQLVGTASDPPEEDRGFVMEDYRDELLSRLMDCDVVIYNVTQHADQVEEASWAVSALHDRISHFSGPKMFILISTVMTWACSKPVDPEDPELPFTDEMFRRRRAHRNFKQHIELEKRVVKMGKTNFPTYVVASGLQYGMGEQILHFFFKTSWLGQEKEIPVFGDGTNIVPMIHINDLASVIQNVIELQPKHHYLLAVDDSNSTMKDVVKVMEIDSLLVNLRMESAHLKAPFSVNWSCESGLVDNMALVVEEYRQTRGLLPVRLCVLGPPAVGKSTVCKQICQHYTLHHITLIDTITETISQLEETVQNADPDGDNDDSVAEAQEQLASLKASMERNGGILDEQQLVKVLKDKLTSNPCRNQGFVLDSFPKTYEQAKELFSGETLQHGSSCSGVRSTCTFKIYKFVLCLDASDAFLKDRVMNLPERQVQEHNYGQEHFLRRLATYRESNMEDITVVNYFEELDISPLNEPDCLLLMQKIFHTVGKPRNYGPDIQEVEREQRRRAEVRMKREAMEQAEEESREAEEARQRAARWEEWTKGLEEARQQEEDLLEAQSVPMRNYLVEHVMPTLTQGLIECCTARPQDPVDFLAEFLLKNNPFNY